MIVRWRRISLVALRFPASCFPFMSTMQRSSGVMNPLEIMVGVQTTSFSLILKLMFPSFPAA